MSVPDPSLLGQILLKQGEIGAQLAAIGEQLKPIKDHEDRLRALEQFRWRMAGIASACGIGAGAICGLGGYLLEHLSR